MSKGTKEETLRHLFSKSNSEGFVLAPLGGQFAEAVNLPTELFAVVVVLGPGVAPPTVSSEFQRHLLENEEKEGFEEIYIKPAMARVVQAVGRLSRGPDANGVALLVDERFATSLYLRHLPRHWYSHSPRELICTDWRREIRNV
jgi:DNA excision repair protein ERCC-2